MFDMTWHDISKLETEKSVRSVKERKDKGLLYTESVVKWGKLSTFYDNTAEKKKQKLNTTLHSSEQAVDDWLSLNFWLFFWTSRYL